ncbi:MAG: hypothetical protein KDC24_12570 [Saprospiraceae bacterium]|nr:hypothetical protein [Saprospiraceae bacterium]
MKAGINIFGLKIIKGITTKTNIPSQNLLKKLGLELKGEITLPDDPEELLLFEWKKD